MKKLLIILFLIFATLIPACAAEKKIFKSAYGVIESIEYQDIENIAGKKDARNIKQEVIVKVLSGKFKGTRRIIDNMITGNPAYDIVLAKGDKVILHIEANSNIVATSDDVNVYISDIKRETSLWVFAGIFCILLVAIGQRKGFNALISIGATVGLIFLMVPFILNGVSPLFSALTVSILSTIITVYLIGGFNPKSTSAILGISASLVLVAALSVAAICVSSLTGFAGEEPMFLYTVRPDLNFKGILSASMIIAALGALMDTGVSIASTINELHETDSSLEVKELFTSGMNVGKDIIGTMSNTLILVYLGASLPLVLLSSNIDLNKFFNLNQVATEISAALIGSIGILACVPITAIIAAYLIKRYQPADFDFED